MNGNRDASQWTARRGNHARLRGFVVLRGAEELFVLFDGEFEEIGVRADDRAAEVDQDLKVFGFGEG